MKICLLMALAILSSCSQISKKAEPKMEPVVVSEKEIQQCLDYQKTVLDRAYDKPKGAKDGSLVFTKDIKLAREVLGKFDVSQDLSKSKSQLVQNILNQCNAENLKEFDVKYKLLEKCTIMFSELNYFQSLAVALNKYSWPTDLKLEGKKVAVDYVKYFSEGSYPLLNRLVALSVLDEMSVNSIVNKDLHKEIRDVMQESKMYVEGLRQKFTKVPGLSCESLEIIRDELNYSDVVAKKMVGFLERI